MTSVTSVTICRTCRPDGAPEDGEPPGDALARGVAERLRTAPDAARVTARAIACLSNCSRGCSATVSAPGKFSYVIGGLEPVDAEALATFALRHAESADGIPPWRERPERIRKNTIARVPPPGADHPLVEDIEEDILRFRR